MTRKYRLASCVLAASMLLLGAARSSAADKDIDKKGDKKTDKGTKKGGKKGGRSFEAKGEKRTPATTIDFQNSLGLSFDSLRGLGARIEQARTAADPVGLAAAARELAVAEKTSGKSASVKSADLLKEATEMARQRNNPDELKAVALLAGDKEDRKALNDQAAKAQKELLARKNGEKKRGITGTLSVINQTRWYIRIYVNYQYVGTVRPFATGSVFVGNSAFGTTVLYASAPGTALTWGPRSVTQAVGDISWTLS